MSFFCGKQNAEGAPLNTPVLMQRIMLHYVLLRVKRSESAATLHLFAAEEKHNRKLKGQHHEDNCDYYGTWRK